MGRPRKKPSFDKVEVSWEAPPENPRTSAKFDDVLDQVKKNPGRWARIRHTDGSGAAYNSRKTLLAKTGGDARWEFVVRRLPDESYGVFARYRNNEQMEAAKSP